MSVDDIIDATDALVTSLGQANNTYFIYTSDHGYSLGELNLNWVCCYVKLYHMLIVPSIVCFVLSRTPCKLART